MNKFGIVFSAAAVVVMAGCKSPEYARKYESKNTVKTCTCAPGTKHTAPCGCGASDCRCVVVAPAPKPVAVAPAPKPVVTPAPKPAVPAPVAPAPEYTTYIVQNGDYLAKISKRYNVTIASIRKLNPSIKKDIVRVGQKIKLPGKVDVGVQRTPAASAVAPAKRKGKKWFIGGICVGFEKERTFDLKLDFLGDGEFKMTAFKDGVNANYQAMHYNKVEQKVNKNTTIKVTMMMNGGFAAVIE